MGESIEHISYVREVLRISYEYIEQKYYPYIHFDTPESDLLPPQTAAGFRPDLYFCNQSILVMGEAKTAQDVETRHSISQLYSYIDECETCGKNAVLILFVPWTMGRTIKKIVRNYRSHTNEELTIVIADNTGHRDTLG